MAEIPMGYEFEIAREAAQAQLDEINDMLARRQEVAAPMSEWTQPPQEPPVRRRAVQPRARPEPAPPSPTKVIHTTRSPGGDLSAEVFEGSAAVSARSWEGWVQAQISRRLSSFTSGALVPALEEAGKICGELRERLDQQAEKIAELEAEIEGMRRKAPPRLVGFADAAD